MPTRKTSIVEGEYYHVLARGVNKQKIFFDKRDYSRFLFYILFYQSPVSIQNTPPRIRMCLFAKAIRIQTLGDALRKTSF